MVSSPVLKCPLITGWLSLLSDLRGLCSRKVSLRPLPLAPSSTGQSGRRCEWGCWLPGQGSNYQGRETWWQASNITIKELEEGIDKEEKTSEKHNTIKRLLSSGSLSGLWRVLPTLSVGPLNPLPLSPVDAFPSPILSTSKVVVKVGSTRSEGGAFFANINFSLRWRDLLVQLLGGSGGSAVRDCEGQGEKGQEGAGGAGPGEGEAHAGDEDPGQESACAGGCLPSLSMTG